MPGRLDGGCWHRLDLPWQPSGSLACCTEAMVQHLDPAFARIWTTSPQGDVLELQASAGLVHPPGRCMPVSPSASSRSA